MRAKPENQVNLLVSSDFTRTRLYKFYAVGDFTV
jgi:hypothetical protein